MRASDRPRGASKMPKPIGGVIDNVIRSLGLTRSFYGWQIVSRWPEIVGEMIAKRATAFRFEDGTLFVAVPDATWRHTLSMQTEEILEKIHNLTGGKYVRRIRLVQGEKGK